MSETIEQRAAIKFCVRLKKSFTETKQMIDMGFGKDVLSRTTVYTWYKRFKDGRQSLGDDERSGRPSTAVTDDNEARVRALMARDRHMSIRMIADELNLGKDSVATILKEKMHRRKVCSRICSAFPHTRTEATSRRFLSRFYRKLRCGSKLLDLNCYRRRKLVLPIWPFDKTAVVRVAQSGRSETSESAPTKIQSENHAHRVFWCQRVNSSRVRASEWNCECYILRRGLKTSQASNSARAARVQGGWIVESVGWQCAGAFCEHCQA